MGCPEEITRALEGLAGVEQVVFDPSARIFTIHAAADLEQGAVERAVAQAPHEHGTGFRVEWIAE